MGTTITIQIQMDSLDKDLAAAILAALANQQPEGTRQLPLLDEAPNTNWTEADIAALYRECKPVQRAILVRIAEGASTPVTYEQLRVAGAAASHNPSFGLGHLPAALSWISKFAIRVKGTPDWPVNFVNRGPQYSEGERKTLAMDQEVCGYVLRAARTA